MTTDSRYVPRLTLIRSPGLDALTAFWMVLNAHFFCLQTVRVLNGPFGLGATFPGSFGSGYVWAPATAGNRNSAATAAASVLRKGPPLGDVRQAVTSYQPAMPSS